MTYTDAQLVLLSAASQRDDGLLPRPAKLAGAALRNLEAALVRAGAAEPIAVRSDQPTWRRDEAEAPIGLRITRTGLEGLGIDPANGVDDARTAADVRQPDHHVIPPTIAPVAAPLRAGTKRALLVQHLSAEEGTNLETLATALGWQPHTIRAALTRLRQGGFTIITSKDAQKRTVYRIEGSQPQSSSAKPTHDTHVVA